ncbi:hypothetical protein NQ314_010555 [Rhamnusium bicolor]|uniref:Protein kinase domain-containing protein n=1 Tax=Rhamnusium bicolor TaxID=1586634 RepID=A0AAV8XPM1_9CUCU|nr:hypothetical protein NQ314_010555 [Rhamnusium bicolor]
MSYGCTAMGSLLKQSLSGNIHRIREFELEKVNLADEFDILQIVGEGWFGKILLVEHKATDTEMVLKALPKPYTSIKDFYREFHYGLHLGVHKNIITAYDVTFETAGFLCIFSRVCTFRTNTSHDVWQFGIVIFVCLTGCLPWQKAAPDDPRYTRYLSWQNSTIPIKRQPKLFKLVSSKAQRLFKKYLEPKPDKRPAGLAEVHRYLDDRWMSKGMEKTNEALKEDEGLCPSMYSFHSSPEEKNKLLFSLTQYGLETTVDRVAKKDRIRQWIQNSVIEEDDENEEEIDEENIKIHDNRNGPIEGRRLTHNKQRDTTARKERRMSTLKKSNLVYKPPIDPRIPLEKQKYLNSKKLDNVATKENSINYENGNIFNHDQNSTLFNISNALPFQNVKISNSLTSSESAISSDSGITVKHNINIQHPQLKNININGSPKEKHTKYKI